MSRPMHIVYDSLGVDPNAYSELLNAWTIVKMMSERQRVTLVMPREYLPRLPENHGLDVVGIPYGVQKWPYNGGLEYTYRLYSERAARAIGRMGDSVSVVHRLNPFGVRYGSPAYRLRAPLVLGPVGGSLYAPGIRPHGREWWIERIKSIDSLRLAMPWSLLRRTYENADAILVSTRTIQSRLPRSVWDKCILRPEGIDTSQFKVMPIPKGTPRILFVGRLIPYKSADILLRALEQCRDLDWALDVVGDGPERARVEGLARSLDIGDRCLFHGWLDQARMPSLYANCSFCCFPSVNESVGMVNLEAMASGRAVVAADWAGPSELLADGAGVLVEPSGVEEYVAGLSAALRTLVVDRERCETLGFTGRRRAEELYDWTVFIDEVEALYQRLHDGAGR